MIRKLPPELIREIAAGEVIGAPVDVLKELLENALDAGANRLELELVGGGSEKLVLHDNGVGIPVEELPLAVERHSTSKLASLETICTLGFRGEGLSAIRHAATLKLTSRPAGQLGGATLLASGEDVTLHEHPAPAGTRAEVTGLFHALPARLRSLDTPAAEERRVIALLSRYLLHHPGLRVRVVSDGVERLNHGGGGFVEAVKLLWGTVSANRLLPLEAEDAGVRVSGLISRPELTRPRRDRLLLAVNGRPVAWPEALLKAALQGYRELLSAGQYPVGIINLTLPAEEVLVNTAPDKGRVRFLQPAEVAGVVRTAVEEVLAGHPLAPALPDWKPSEGVRAAPRHGFPQLSYLGRFRELYLLAEADETLWLIDQHAAHERIVFEELRQRYQSEAPCELHAPELLPLTPDEAARYRERAEALAGWGIRLEPFGAGTYRVRTVPAFLLGHPELIAEAVKGTLVGDDAEAAWRAVLARLACLPAIKAGSPLDTKGAQALLDALRSCDTPWACPHGRPTALVVSELELARRFGRRGVRAVAKRVEDEVL